MNKHMKLLRSVPESGYRHVGWGQPEYTGWIDESLSWKTTCYVGDWSWLLEVHVTGSDALRLFSDLSVNSMARFDIAQAKHCIQCNKDGKVVAEGILMRLGREDFVFDATVLAYWTKYKAGSGDYSVTTGLLDWTNFQVSGPNALYLVEKMAGESMRDIEFMHFRKIMIRGREVIALRQGMAGEIGYELMAPMEYYQEILDAIMEAGREFGIRRLGGRAAMINHLEACFPTIMTDYIPAVFSEDEEGRGYREAEPAAMDRISTIRVGGSYEAEDVSAYYRSPVELGWTRNIRFDHDFIGRKALEAEVSSPKRTMVTLVWNAEDVVDVYASMFRDGDMYHFMDMPREQLRYMWADRVLKDGRLIGIATSRGYSVYFHQMISLCTIDVEFRKPGTEVTVVWGNPGEPQKQLRATVAPVPYKKDNRRMDLTTLPSYLNRSDT